MNAAKPAERTRARQKLLMLNSSARPIVILRWWTSFIDANVRTREAFPPAGNELDLLFVGLLERYAVCGVRSGGREEHSPLA